MTSVLTIGNFDGLHIGHRKLIATTIALARSRKADAVAMTFAPHPKQYFSPAPHFFIHPEPVKEQILDSLGLDDVIYLPFADIHGLTPQQFFDGVVMPLDPAAIVLGANFTFGTQKSGDISLLRRMCAGRDIALHSLAMAPYDGGTVSSSRIRAAIQTGCVEDAANMLSAPYALYGPVEHGAGRGHALGFATANIHAPDQVMPKHGVYATHVSIDGERARPAVTAVTQTPTFETVRTVAESHILDFSGDIYGHPIKVEFNRFIRDERAFGSKEELVRQLSEDCRKARSLHDMP